MCQGCPPNTPSNYNLQYLYNPDCTDCGQNSCMSSADVAYKGPLLSCIGVNTGDALEVALQKIDERVCGITGDYSGFNFACLAGITNEQSFVEGISAYVCSLNSSFVTFRDTTYASNQSVLDGRINAVEKPAVTGCSSYLSFSADDSLQTVLNKLSGKVCAIHNNELDLSNILWNGCLNVTVPPSSVPEAFQLLADQICTIKGGTGNSVLPTINNTGSCLTGAGASDSLVDTIGKIRSRLCQTPVFDINAINWGCTAKPSTDTTNIQGAFQSALDGINDYKQNKLTFSSDFNVILTDNSNPCLGKTVSLATPINQDKSVAATSSDTSPGTLQDKLEAGAGITLDAAVTAGKIRIISTGSASDGKAGLQFGDTPGYLGEKISGGTQDGLTINPAISGDVLQLLPSVNFGTFLGLMFDELENNPDLKSRFCQIMATCPSPCAAPTNIQAIVVA